MCRHVPVVSIYFDANVQFLLVILTDVEYFNDLQFTPGVRLVRVLEVNPISAFQLERQHRLIDQVGCAVSAIVLGLGCASLEIVENAFHL